MIVLMTDFGLEGPYVGQITAVLHRRAPSIPVVNLFADLPAFNPNASAYLVSAYVKEFPAGTIFLGVVDPGVGSARRPVVVEADGKWFVGPDNGLFNVVCKRAKVVRRWIITYRPSRLSASFHGRDLFAPVASLIAKENEVPGERLNPTAQPWTSWPNDLFEVIYIDHYGNAMTGVRASQVDHNRCLALKDCVIKYAYTFSEAVPNKPFWYENSNELIEIALQKGSVSKALDLKVGDPFCIRRCDG
jgi:S-adenosylmethionine hydrolase